MNLSALQQSEHPIAAELPNNLTIEQSTLPTWHQPTITRIDIKRTLNSAVSGVPDCHTVGGGTPCP